MLCQHCNFDAAEFGMQIRGNGVQYGVSLCAACHWFYTQPDLDSDLLWLALDRQMCEVIDWLAIAQDR